MSGLELKQQRTAKLLTQRELSLLSGVSQEDIDSFERGFKNLDADQMQAIREALNKWNGDNL